MYKIAFSGLSLGHHTFEFFVDDAFFAEMWRVASPQNDNEFSNCHVNIKINLEKTERFLKLDFQFDGHYVVPCDRCLDPVEIPIEHDETLIVNFGNENDFDSEVWTISAKEHELILNAFIYETLVLLRPFSVMHEIEDCNQDMIEKLQIETGNVPSPQQNDPRWEALKTLKDKLDKQ